MIIIKNLYQIISNKLIFPCKTWYFMNMFYSGLLIIVNRKIGEISDMGLSLIYKFLLSYFFSRVTDMKIMFTSDIMQDLQGNCCCLEKSLAYYIYKYFPIKKYSLCLRMICWF